eukprot:5754789-Amphidinium_carterae.1
MTSAAFLPPENQLAPLEHWSLQVAHVEPAYEEKLGAATAAEKAEANVRLEEVGHQPIQTFVERRNLTGL